MSRRPSWVTWRVVLAAGVMWLADLAWDLYEALQGVSWRIQQPGRRSQRGLARLLVLAALSGMSLTAGLAWSLRGTEERPGVEAARPARPVAIPGETSAAIVEGFSLVSKRKETRPVAESTIATAIVSPSARPKPRTREPKIPVEAVGSITFRITSHRFAPRP